MHAILALFRDSAPPGRGGNDIDTNEMTPTKLPAQDGSVMAVPPEQAAGLRSLLPCRARTGRNAIYVCLATVRKA